MITAIELAKQFDSEVELFHFTSAAIIEETKRDFDLVVMGRHGHGLITGNVIGSVTQRVLAHAQCPVLVVK